MVNVRAGVTPEFQKTCVDLNAYEELSSVESYLEAYSKTRSKALYDVSQKLSKAGFDVSSLDPLEIGLLKACKVMDDDGQISGHHLTVLKAKFPSLGQVAFAKVVPVLFIADDIAPPAQ